MRMNLRRARADLSMTIKEISESIHVHPRYYQKLECGSVIGSVSVWDRLEDLTGIHQRVLRENE